MQEYSITNEQGEWITGNIQKGCYEWTANKERRYAVLFEKACEIAEQFGGIVLREA